MMQTMYSPGGDGLPKIILDAENGIFELSGRCIPDDADEFFDPIFEWLRKYAKNPNEDTVFTFNLEYFNSATAKRISDLADLLDEMHDAKHQVGIQWLHEPEDLDMRDQGAEFKEILKLPFEIKEVDR